MADAAAHSGRHRAQTHQSGTELAPGVATTAIADTAVAAAVAVVVPAVVEQVVASSSRVVPAKAAVVPVHFPAAASRGRKAAAAAGPGADTAALAVSVLVVKWAAIAVPVPAVRCCGTFPATKVPAVAKSAMRSSGSSAVRVQKVQTGGASLCCCSRSLRCRSRRRPRAVQRDSWRVQDRMGIAGWRHGVEVEVILVPRVAAGSAC